MELYNILAIDDPSERLVQLQEYLEGQSWLEAEHTSHGGWPEDEEVSNVRLEDDPDDPEFAIVRFAIHASESIPSSCKDWNDTQPIHVEFEMHVYKSTGDYYLLTPHINDNDDENPTHGGDFI